MTVFIRFPERESKPAETTNDTFIDEFVKAVSKHLALFAIDRGIELRWVDDFGRFLSRALNSENHICRARSLRTVLKDPTLFPMIEEKFIQRLRDNGL